MKNKVDQFHINPVLYISISFFLILSTAVALYFQGLSGGLLLDDYPQLSPILYEITAQNWILKFNQFYISNSGYLGRPIPMTTFIINAALFGDDIWYWKLTNVILHGFCGFTIFLCTYLLLSLNKRFSSRQTVLIALSTSFIWLVHPLHVSTVLYTVQRMTILSTLFTFLALSCYLYAITKYLKHKKGIVYLILSLGFFLLATLSKESGILYPVYILLMHFYLKYQLENYDSIVNPKIMIYINSIYIILLIGLICFVILFDRFTLSYGFREFTLTERVLTEARVILLYLNQIIIPHPSTMGFFHDDFSISKDLLTPYTTLASIIFLVILISSLLIKFKKLGIVSLGLLFFFSSHLLESTVLPLEMVFEHRNYIGSWGIILAIVYLLFVYFDNTIYSILCITIVFCTLTFYRTHIWGNPNTLFPHMFKLHPDSLRLKIIFSDTYSKAKQYDKAISYLQNENSLGAKLHLINIKCQQTKKLNPDILINLMEINNIKIGSYEIEGLINLANLGLDKKCIFNKNEFINLLNKTLLFPIIDKTAEQKLLLYLAHYYHELKQPEKYLATLQTSFLKDKSNPIPLFLKIDWLIELKRYQEAKDLFIVAKQTAKTARLDYSNFISHTITALTKAEQE